MHALQAAATAHLLAPHDVPEITGWSATLRNVNEPRDLT
jgi:hypothetical protein